MWKCSRDGVEKIMVCILNAYVLLEEKAKFSATANVALRTRSAESYPISNEGTMETVQSYE